MTYIEKLAQDIAKVIACHARDVNIIVRDREAYIDAEAPNGRDDPDFHHPGFSKIEISISLKR